MVLYGPQGNSLGLLYALANKFAVFSQVYSTTGKQVFPPSSPSAVLANFLYQPTLCLMQNFSPITYPSKGIRWLLYECELVTVQRVKRLCKDDSKEDVAKEVDKHVEQSTHRKSTVLF